MSLLDRAIACSGIPEHRPHAHIPCLRYPSIRRQSHCYAKVKLDDNEQESQAPHRGFSIRVPTIPKLGDIELARRLFESAFQALSFDMPKIPDSALQGLPFGIPKLSIPMRFFVLDITGFVVTKLKRPQKKVLEDILLDENQYPRCAWPRTVKGGQIAEVANIGLLTDTQHEEACNKIPVGPHCAWPRTARQVTGASRPSSAPSIIVADLNKLSVAQEEVDIFPSIVEGGARCAWPRKVISAKQSYCTAESTDNTGKDYGSQQAEDISGDKVLPAECNEAAEWPRRMLATSVGLTMMNQLAKGSIVTSIFDFCSLLPAGTLEISEEEDAVMHIGRRTLLVFIKGSGD